MHDTAFLPKRPLTHITGLLALTQSATGQSGPGQHQVRKKAKGNTIGHLPRYLGRSTSIHRREMPQMRGEEDDTGRPLLEPASNKGNRRRKKGVIQLPDNAQISFCNNGGSQTCLRHCLTERLFAPTAIRAPWSRPGNAFSASLGQCQGPTLVIAGRLGSCCLQGKRIRICCRVIHTVKP